MPTLTEQSREQSLLMQDIALDYASRNASVGASFFGGGEERPLDDLASRFSVNLLKLQQAPQNDEEIARALRSVAIKWHYIEKSLRNYNQNSVPFLVNKNADRIIDGLEKVAALYAARNHEPRRAASGALEKLGDAPGGRRYRRARPNTGQGTGRSPPPCRHPREAAQGVQQLIVRARLAPLVQPLARGILPIGGRVGAGSGTARRTSAERSPANAANPGARAAWPAETARLRRRAIPPRCLLTASARPGD